MYCYSSLLYVTVVSWAQMICLICIPMPEGRKPEGMGYYISEKSRGHMIQLTCVPCQLQASTVAHGGWLITQANTRTTTGYIIETN